MRRVLLALILVAAGVCAATVLSSGADEDYPFGTRIIDIDLTLAPSAIAELEGDTHAEVPAQLRMADARGAMREHRVSLRIKGGDGSRRTLEEKPSFRIAFAKDDRLFGLEGLTLNNMVQDHTMVHEALGYPFYDSLGVPVPRTGYARVAVNGQPYGLYLNLESIEKPFLERRIGDARGILYEGAYGVDLRESDIGKFELHAGADAGRSQLRAFVKAVDTPGDDVLYGDHPIVDLGAFLRMTAAEGIIEDWDSYYHSNNYRIYWIPSSSRWVFIPTGIDQTFVANSTPVFGATGLLFQKCLASERCTRDFEAIVSDVLQRFERAGLPARLDELVRLIGPASDADPRRPYDDDRMHGARERLGEFLKRRPAEVRDALACVEEERAGILGACTGMIVKRGTNECLEVVPSDAETNPGGVGIASCTGTFNERWRVRHVATGVQLSPVTEPRKCVATQSGPAGATLILASCDSGADSFALSSESDVSIPIERSQTETWHIRRSIFD